MTSYTPWTIRHVDVDIGLGTPVHDEGPLFAVFWRGEVPLGHAWIDASQLPLSAGKLRRRASADPPDPARKPETAASIAVVIPTRGRPHALERCLASVAGLNDVPDEIVVVDNSSGDEQTRHVVARFPGVRYVVEASPGASIARNTGFAATGSDIVAFVDDDEVVHPGWSRSLRMALSNGDFGLVTGLVLPASLHAQAQYLFERRFSFIRGYDRRVFRPDEVRSDRKFAPWHLGGSGNLAVRREVFERVGGFDARLGAGRSGCSEDTDFFQRVLESGTVCCYDPRAVVFHEHRSDLGALKSQAFKYMRGHATALLIAWSERGDPFALRRLLRSLPAYYAATLLRLFRGDDGIRAGVVAMEVAGCFLGIVGFLFSRAHRYARSAARADFFTPSKSIQSPVSV